ncbi:STAS domain-containing protein [Mesobacillus harenae]|uniref:STAS domain-containing protein n=1 Tax=Mesobacillus harenae TaxID=2213203 RepID=UPI001580453B|nr:STAS domain-containing protein [Mesobacillus harenae]
MPVGGREETPELNVAGFEFKWDLAKGVFSYQGADAVLFWITSAMKTFFDTVEEVSGKDATNVVLETSGFRQGKVVGEYIKSLNIESAEISSMIPEIYAAAGWGKIEIDEICPVEKKARVHIRDSWEYKINKEQGKQQTGNFLAGHYAGLFSAIYETSLWFEKKKDQLAGDDFCIYEFFPSTITVEKNIHSFARREESLRIKELETLVEARTEELRNLVKEISSPVIPVLEGIVVVPLLGKYDEFRSEELVERTLSNLPKHKADYLVLDLTGLTKSIGQFTVEVLNKLASAAALIGTETILVGISPELGVKITETNFKLSKFNCFNTLQHGIYYALAQKGRKVY